MVLAFVGCVVFPVVVGYWFGRNGVDPDTLEGGRYYLDITGRCK